MRRIRRWRFLVGTALLAAAVMITGMPVADAAPFRDEPLDPPSVIEDPPFVAPANGFDWKAPSRFGRDDNRDGITDYHWNDWTRPPEHGGPAETYDPAWVHPTSFPIDFDACPTAEEAARSDASQPTANTYTWVIDGTTHQPNPPDCRLAHSFPAEGTYSASLTITRPDGTTEGPHAQEVRVRDLLIVSLGDSYGSGEGNPDRTQVMGTDSRGFFVEQKAEWVDKRCHRSAHAGPAQAARRIEGSDPKTSVTFLSFACSGATIDTVWGTHALEPYKPPDPVHETLSGTGVLGPYKGPEGPYQDPINPRPRHEDYGDRDPAWDSKPFASDPQTTFPFPDPSPSPDDDPQPVSYPEFLPSQLDQLKQAIKRPDGSLRPIDSLVVSGGGNDAGFGPLASVCVIELWNCMDVNVHSRDNPDVKIPLDERFPQDLAALPGKYDQLQAALTATGIPVARTYVTEYPGSTTGDDGQPCKAMLDDVVRPNLNAIRTLLLAAAAQVAPGGHLDLTKLSPYLLLLPLLNTAVIAVALLVPLLVATTAAVIFSQTRSMADQEVVWAGETVAPGINARMDHAARRHGWTYVGGIGAPYVGHGYCAANSYIRRAPEASMLQGPYGPMENAGIHGATTGTLHPNVTGHSQYANQIFPLLSQQFDFGAGSTQFTILDVDPVLQTQPRHGKSGWLTGRCPAGSADCTSDAAVVTVEANDPSGLKGAEFTVDGQPGCPVGMTCQATLVDPFTYRWTFTITRDGFSRLGFSVSSRFGDLSTFGHEVKVDLHDPTAAAALESPTAPTGLRFEGDDGQGSGVHEIAFDGLWHGNTPGSAKPGNSVPIDLGGNYVVRFRAVDEAGRTGPWQTQNLTLGGPTMSGTPEDPESGAHAQAQQDCNQFPNETTSGQNLVGTVDAEWPDGLPVALSTPRTHANAVPARLALAARGEATRIGRCDVYSRLNRVPLSVEAGTSGLAPGDRVTLQAKVHFAGALTENPDASDWSRTWTMASGSFHVRDPMNSPLVDFLADTSRQIWVGPAYDERHLAYGYRLSSNLEPTQEEKVSDQSNRRGPFRFPVEEWTITFETTVGTRNVVYGSLNALAEASGEPGTRSSSESDFAASLDIKPAPGFEGVQVIRGNPQPNVSPDAVDDTAEVEGDAGVTVDVLANDTDPDSDALTVTEVSDPPHGTATVGTDNRVTYTPDGDFPGRDSFTYTVSDGKGGTDTATVRVRAEDVTAPAADFDGDGGSDVSVFRPPDGLWFAQGGPVTPWGTAGDIPVPGDYDGDGTVDAAVFRPAGGIWFVKGGPTLAWGTAGDIPVPGDYDGDGSTEMAVYRPSMALWFVRDGATTAYGTDGDVPVPGDYDGDGSTDVAVFRPSTGAWFIRHSSGGETVVLYGTAGDIPVPGDYDADGDTDIAVFRPSTGFWFVDDGPMARFGTTGDIPVPGDYDGDGDTDFALFRPSTGVWFVHGGLVSQFGTSGDVPLPLPDAIRRFSFPPL